jgi:hypothetical protein
MKPIKIKIDVSFNVLARFEGSFANASPKDLFVFDFLFKMSLIL